MPSEQPDDDQPSEELRKSPAYQRALLWFNEVNSEIADVNKQLQILESRKYALVNTSLKLGSLLEELQKEFQK